jgi:molecular chaperone GrpE
MAAISQLGGMVEQRLSTLQSLFDREVRAEATRERIVDRLHAELQEYKQDLLLKVQRPIFIDLIQLHDDIGKTIEAQPNEDADRAAAVRGTLESIRTAILDILYRQGVEPFQTEGDEFEPRRQRAVTTVPVDEPGRNRTIAGRLRPGFQAGEKIIRAELVSVYTVRACKRLP